MGRGWEAETQMLALAALRTSAYGRQKSQSRRALAEAADSALKEATDEERQVYRAVLVEGMDAKAACDGLYMSLGTFYRIKRKLVRRVAERIR